MPRKVTRRMASGEVTVSRLDPEPVTQVNAADLLYVPVPQLMNAADTFKVTYEWITPEEAQNLLDAVADEPDFRQRKIDHAQAQRWKNLLETKRFLHYFPGGPLARDESGIQINGQHRMKGIVLSGIPAGLVVFHNTPRWMFRFFDTNKHRSLTDVLEIGGRHYRFFTASALKLALRYEEFVRGRRHGEGWRHWAEIKDEHQDLDYFYERRTGLQEWHADAGRIYSNARLLAASVLVFAYYQSLAWPEGMDELEEFLGKLQYWRQFPPEHPARVLATWSNDSHLKKESFFGKRELHLSMLMRTFGQHVNGSRIHTVIWAYGNPMSMPYHPKGPQTAVNNIRKAIAAMDEDHHEHG